MRATVDVGGTTVTPLPPTRLITGERLLREDHFEFRGEHPGRRETRTERQAATAQVAELRSMASRMEPTQEVARTVTTSPQVRAMIQLQRLTGMRPGEVMDADANCGWRRDGLPHGAPDPSPALARRSTCRSRRTSPARR